MSNPKEQIDQLAEAGALIDIGASFRRESQTSDDPVRASGQRVAAELVFREAELRIALFNAQRTRDSMRDISQSQDMMTRLMKGFLPGSDD